MPEPRRIDPTAASGALLIEHCDIPADMTLGEWRRQCAEDARRPGRRRRPVRGLRRALGLG